MMRFSWKLIVLTFVASVLQAEDPHPKDPHGHSTDSSNEEHTHSSKGDAKHKEDGHEKGEKGDEHGDHEKEGHGNEEHHDEEMSSNVGPGKAVLEANPDQGIKLSEKAMQMLDLRFQLASAQTPYRLPQSALVSFKDETGVYRVRHGWFKLIEGKVSNNTSGQITFQPEHPGDLQSEDQVVIQGVPLLRVAELEAFGGSGEGHGH